MRENNPNNARFCSACNAPLSSGSGFSSGAIVKKAQDDVYHAAVKKEIEKAEVAKNFGEYEYAVVTIPNTQHGATNVTVNATEFVYQLEPQRY